MGLFSSFPLMRTVPVHPDDSFRHSDTEEPPLEFRPPARIGNVLQVIVGNEKEPEGEILVNTKTLRVMTRGVREDLGTAIAARMAGGKKVSPQE